MTRKTLKPAPARPELDALIKRANEWFDSLTPEQQAEHRKAQLESWVRGEMGLTKSDKERGYD